MSLLGDVKFLIKKYIKNPVLIAVGAYILWKFIQKQKKKESLVESIKIIDKENDIFYDNNLNKYIYINKQSKVFSSDSLEDLKRMVK